ncbi:multicopper oxidase family protein [Nitrosomonas ureae]|uniref:FtsP/CotA-like multicopper oxidase with cupredoxin domain n=1 Tax=Nitrosomonas ureae TaxID=44577 RepID=A0A0S3AJT6_9PROT|nr:multicopper oxidase domain-containing protein [Nitrosomonas ureae]ALQ51390.1 bilirubin oxidase [Nitrosomonas ureae]PTQ81056.1 FtsP/CotA-like multicopper oxidase with cupredoxin domain [Nitrosomonas ureae]PXX12612.1 FtsP/CotA-like multicopper oxidase with cupredoxin domain [Nitrosomonas ureae]SDU10772.1 Multicopper oxidase with three cupredoxin domains (includes cell division protein FtsP and spore coat protein CotA) [Nitrosomonas ureae]
MKNGEYESDRGNTADSDSPSNESRRAFFKTTGAAVLAAPAILTSRKSSAQLLPEDESLPPSPRTTPWKKELPEAIESLEQTDLASGTYPPLCDPRTADGECGRASHQRWEEFFGIADYPLQPGQADTYELRATPIADHEFHPDYEKQLVWNYVGKDGYTNPVIRARYGRPVILRLYNDLPANHSGFGTPEISLHLHNLHTPSESDGFPGDYFSATKAGPTLNGPGQFKDHFYPNVYAGYDEFPKSPSNPVGGDKREALGTLWYHDHCLDFTASNANRGMAGFYLIYDELDSNDEHDPNPAALRLPSGAYDYPLAFQDKRFDANTIQVFNELDSEGTLGDKVTVNGKIEPVLKVASRKYRLRLLNAGPSRFYQFHLVTANNVQQSFTYIANDGNLLPKPLLNRKNVRLGVAERADIVVDFSAYPLGTELYLVNRWEQTSSRGPKGVKGPGMKVLKIIVDREPDEPDVSQVPAKLRPIRRPTATEIATAPVRYWRFERKNGMWAINDKFMNARSAGAHMALGSFEIWELDNPSGGWSHPVHIHFEEGHILKRYVNGIEVTVPVHERGRKDVYVLGPNEKIRVFIRFRDFPGKYVMHCHNTIHEDNAMMVRWDILG